MMVASILRVLEEARTRIEKIVGPVVFETQAADTCSIGIIYKRDISPGLTKHTEIARFGLGPFLGNCGLAISTGVRVLSPFSGKGLGKILLEVRERALIMEGYSVAIETCAVSLNPGEISLLKKSGYEIIKEFKNLRTGNIIQIFAKDIRKV